MRLPADVAVRLIAIGETPQQLALWDRDWPEHQSAILQFLDRLEGAADERRAALPNLLAIASAHRGRPSVAPLNPREREQQRLLVEEMKAVKARSSHYRNLKPHKDVVFVTNDIGIDPAVSVFGQLDAIVLEVSELERWERESVRHPYSFTLSWYTVWQCDLSPITDGEPALHRLPPPPLGAEDWRLRSCWRGAHGHDVVWRWDGIRASEVSSSTWR